MLVILNKIIFLLRGGNEAVAISKLPIFEKIPRLIKVGGFGTLRFILSKSVQKFRQNGLASLFEHTELKVYGKWWNKYAVSEIQQIQQRKLQEDFLFRPLISVIVPVYNPSVKYLHEAILSVKNQTYTNWELCISDDNSPNVEVLDYLHTLSKESIPIKINFRKENGHISLNSNDALALACGEYVALFDHDDVLTPDAFFEVVKALNENEKHDFIYTDEDKINDSGELSSPHFKPDFCLDNLLSRNYITHLSVIRTEIINEIGGFRQGYEGSQDYDLFLRVVSKTTKIHHIPKVLYHWRMHENSAAMSVDQKPYAYDSGRRALSDYFDKSGQKAEVKMIDGMHGFYEVEYELLKKDKVSIIIPSKDKAEILDNCLTSIFKKSTYTNFEIIIVDNGSSQELFFNIIEKFSKQYPNNFKCIKCDYAFNYSRLINDGAKVCKGNYLLLLNNDTEIITESWIEKMLQYSQRDVTGCVGAKLLYKNRTIQHAGVILGLKGVACHTFIGYARDDFGYYGFLKAVSNYSSVTAACMMVQKTIFDKVMGFDETLAVEYNDVDFCLKVKELGYFNVFLPTVELYHFESVSRGNPLKTSASTKRHFLEEEIIRKRWGNYIDFDPCYSPNLSLTHVGFKIKSQ